MLNPKLYRQLKKDENESQIKLRKSIYATSAYDGTKEQNKKSYSDYTRAIVFEIDRLGYIDVGDGCWIRNMLVTTIPNIASGTTIQKTSPTLKFCHQHPKTATNITMSSTSLSPIGWIPGSTRTNYLVRASKIGPCLEMPLWSII